MKINSSFFRLKAVLIGILLFQFYSGFSQEDNNSALYKTIMSKDSLLFNVGFNTCDISQFENLFTDDFEFYHDKDSISDKALFLKNLKKGLCGSIGTYQARRYLVPNSTEIYPLYKKGVLYGAMQMGIHQFYEKSVGKNESLANAKENFGSTARFTHVWLLQNGVWKLRRSFSYDHQTKNNIGTKTK
ncbi:nuclear transport factor 2 family protein [Flavobacterium pectinovorum]|uniref:nuclear transport factor 2 family protein n=1 Tax=Flavobacterium pectinovorum TaxID=29533 RepID=UPI00265E4230|nr:nuclear transport factor 2 family protein [Flavobacterium pectinovorum]WKL46222.1 nuclear transport factor 2 family protein [Flavobacterium pectinovorum]